VRIISGSRKGKRLLSVKGGATRPTADRLRESIFNIQAANVPGSRVLDLFAGTGALAIEALSRGARSAILVDNAAAALGVIRKNLANCGFVDRAQVIRWDIHRNLNCLRHMNARFDLIFMDPPYAQGLIQPTLNNLVKSASLAPQATLILEHAASEPIDFLQPPFQVVDQRRYGKTLVTFLATML
jgi:16S rRNA (guanine966-N2)-methyltransferase